MAAILDSTKDQCLSAKARQLTNLSKERVTLFDLSVRTWHKVQFMAIKPEINELLENPFLEVENASGKH